MAVVFGGNLDIRLRISELLRERDNGEIFRRIA